ncbi:MAG: cache domain-containing protein [Patescibacteria group bacterium]|nr:cache domain-containing protein [Patescibacteria group bacterium]
MFKKRPKSLAAIIVLAVILVLAVAYAGKLETRRVVNLSDKQIQAVKIQNQDSLIKSETQTAISMLQAVYDKSAKGEYSLSKAKTLGADLLRNLRYGPSNQRYFFADTLDGINVVLYGNKDVEGKNRLNDTVNGISYIKDIIAKSQAGGGYTDYFYPKITGGEPLAKRAYSMEFQPFGWSVGTGYYLEDVK